MTSSLVLQTLQKVLRKVGVLKSGRDVANNVDGVSLTTAMRAIRPSAVTQRRWGI